MEETGRDGGEEGKDRRQGVREGRNGHGREVRKRGEGRKERGRGEEKQGGRK